MSVVEFGAVTQLGTYLHEVGGGGDDGHHDAADGEAHKDAAVGARPGAEDEEGELAVGGGERPVGEAGAVGVAEGQDGREYVADEDVVPFHRGEELGEHADGDCSERDVA